MRLVITTRVVLLSFLLLAPSVWATDHTVTNCNDPGGGSPGDAQTQANALAMTNGDRLVFPSCTATWTVAVTIPASAQNVTIIGNGTCTGCGSLNTPTGLNTKITANATSLFTYNATSGGSLRVTALDLGGDPGGGVSGFIILDGTFANARLDRIYFHPTTNSRSVVIGYNGQGGTTAITGLIDHVTWKSAGIADATDGFGLYYGTNNSWNQPDNWGSSSALFLEQNGFDCSAVTTNPFNGAPIMDVEFGGRVVVRHNEVKDCNHLVHDAGSTQLSQGSRTEEVYANTFTCSRYDCGFAPIQFRGGPWLVYDNSFPLCQSSCNADPKGWESANAVQITRVDTTSCCYSGGAPWNWTAIPNSITTGTGASVRSSNTVTVTFTAHALRVADVIVASSCTDSSFNGTFQVATAAANSFTYPQSAPNATTGNCIYKRQDQKVCSDRQPHCDGGTNPACGLNETPAGADTADPGATCAVVETCGGASCGSCRNHGSSLSATVGTQDICGNGNILLAYIDGSQTGGYPVFAQVGRGQWHYTTGSSAHANSDLSPVYWWNNVDSNSSNAQEQTMNLSGQDAYLTQNTDFYMHNCSSAICDKNSGFIGGTTGVGRGTSLNPDNRPTSCTVGVAYWSTDENKLYRCTQASPAVWTSFYTPYTYPHPLQ